MQITFLLILYRYVFVLVDFRENDPKKGYIYIIVSIPELTVISTLFAKNKPQNIEICSADEIFREK